MCLLALMSLGLAIIPTALPKIGCAQIPGRSITFFEERILVSSNLHPSVADCGPSRSAQIVRLDVCAIALGGVAGCISNEHVGRLARPVVPCPSQIAYVVGVRER